MTRGDILRDLLHAVISRSGLYYVGEVVELPVVTQGRTLEQTVANLRDAIALHLAGEDRQWFGIAERARVAVSYEIRIDA